MTDLERALSSFRNDPSLEGNICRWEVVPPKPARYAPFPTGVPQELVSLLQRRGIDRLYSHQADCVDRVLSGQHVVVVTPTASGKTLCYNIPVLSSIFKDPEARALYLFPTKALAQDQLADIHDVIEDSGRSIKTFTYDGDTPQQARKAIRTAGHVVITNPDMLHTAILPHHTKWVKLFSNLKYIVIDELHYYRGVFGSHFANVIRRLHRICEFYGSSPQVIASSATIANPKELAETLVERHFHLVAESGAPQGERHLLFYNPPVVNRQLGIRRSAMLEAKRIARPLLGAGVQTIVFTRSRTSTEILLTYLQELAGERRSGPKSRPPAPGQIRGYRGGYLPRERREIEKGLRDGAIRAVVSTNALELGIDIGNLDACVMVGYPGSVSSTWQQVGRAGRRTGVSAAVLIASSSPLDQYIVSQPGYFFGASPEQGLANPNNMVIMANHVKCAAYELPFMEGELFGSADPGAALELLAEEHIVHKLGNRWYWMSESFPAEDISLRSATAENFVIVDITRTGQPLIIGEVDRISAPTLVHEEAIYIHQGQLYQVEKLDYAEKKAFVKQVGVDYYTDANLAVDLQVLQVDSPPPPGQSCDTGADYGQSNSQQLGLRRDYGNVLVTAIATMFKKIKFHTHENIGSGPINLPEEQMHTDAYWLSLGDDVCAQLSSDEVEEGLVGLANIMANLAPVHLLCEPGDIRPVIQVRSPFTGRPTIYFYERYPGGVGLSQRLYTLHHRLLKTAQAHVKSCPCQEGCPSCVGPINEIGPSGKSAAARILTFLGNHQSEQEARLESATTAH